MGQSFPKSEPNHGHQDTPSTTAPVTSSPPFPDASPNKELLHLILAFFAGVLLTLLLMAFVFLIIKSYKKCHSSPQALDPHSDSPAKLLDIPGESLTHASMTFKTSEAKSNHLTENHSADSDPIVYAQIKVTN
ncbi:transmembrane protein C1orf162 homolog [Trichechus inunguis]|uniref:Transmembrane protein C1orf162 homolog n=1 Tax=Trichechus manatus latirostris TaxID=127582 RepID=A0A2Y9RG94_TRIMA|nr:transmembrane protein C1orf162 homolog [Trichechus manatus latirostris]XP_023590597.1 transmembrane protein C1orf162 homolog [Trichechus manatus latirostris]XP_023590598.1 transmembrane protein C1orf162 homolog [Trichechus manatus latirostris]